MRKIGNKGSIGLFTNKTVNLVLITVVFVTLFLFFFRINPITWLKNYIPEYDTEDREIIQDKDIVADSKACPVLVAKIKEDKIYQYIGVAAENIPAFMKTNLIWKGNSIVLEKSLGTKVGEVKNEKIEIDERILEGDTNIRAAQFYSEFPSYEFLMNLDGSYYLSGNLLCREEELKIENIPKEKISLTYDEPVFVKLNTKDKGLYYRYTPYMNAWEFSKDSKDWWIIVNDLTWWQKIFAKITSGSLPSKHQFYAKFLVGKNEWQGLGIFMELNPLYVDETENIPPAGFFDKEIPEGYSKEPIAEIINNLKENGREIYFYTPDGKKDYYYNPITGKYEKFYLYIDLIDNSQELVFQSFKEDYRVVAIIPDVSFEVRFTDIHFDKNEFDYFSYLHGAIITGNKIYKKT